jgi:glycosyltransferase involved in cell wall biosynthesis
VNLAAPTLCPAPPTVCVVICAYDMVRWDQLVAAVESVQAQSSPVEELVVVVDHNPELLVRAQQQWDGAPVRVVASDGDRGLSGARNTGVAAARSEVVAFLDDDAVAEPAWIGRLLEPYADAQVQACGGGVVPILGGPRPRWWPLEFDWVIGCSYAGMPGTRADVRNVIGANMSARRAAIVEAGGFPEGIGRVGARPVGCEETDLFIRVGRQAPGARIVYEPAARVHHHVPPTRLTWGYFRARCLAEGQSKALVAARVGRADALASERAHALRILPAGMLRAVRRGAPTRAVTIAAGLALATAGYVGGRLARRPPAPAPDPDLGAVRLVDVELTEAVADVDAGLSLSGRPYRRLALLVRVHRRPLGMVHVDLPAEGLDAGLVADAIWAQLDTAVQAHFVADGLAPPEKLTARGLGQDGPPPCDWRTKAGAGAPLASVVVTTCGGPSSRLHETLDDILAQTYPNLEVVVVDNRPTTSAVRAALDANFAGDERLRYAAEARPGLSHARNRGAAVAGGGIVAFTDDDVEIDRDWLARLVAGFDDPRVGCVTGLILPLELETPAQRLLEEFGGYAKGFERRVWDATEHRLASPLYPYTVGAFGSGANAAFRSDVLAALGGFDGALGTGTPARGGEDIDLYVTCVQQGWRIVYEPAALLRHAHLRDADALAAKIHDYGVGLGAMLTKHLLRSPASAAGLLVRVPRGVVYLLSSRSPKNASRTRRYPRSLAVAEVTGLLYGPVAYLRSRFAQ